MNKIVEMFDSISDAELKEAIIEIHKAEKTGIFESESIIRKYAIIMCDLTSDNNISSHLFTVQVNILKRGAYKYVNI